MYKLELQQNPLSTTKQFQSRSRQKESRQQEDNKSRQMKQNDSKHMNAIRPYVTKQRKNSKRQIKPTGSTTEINRSRNKRLQSTSSNRKSDQKQQNYHQGSIISCCENISFTGNNANSQQSTTKQRQKEKEKEKQIREIYEEMMRLKSQYKQLKTSYNNLVQEKQQATSREQIQKQSNQKQKLQLCQELEKSKKAIAFFQTEIQRMKRQCFKIIQSQKFKYKKLQEILEEKELMIAYLRKEIEALRRGNNGTKEQLNSSVSQQENLERIFFLQNSAPIFSYESYARLSANTSSISNINNVNVLIEEHDTEGISSESPRPSLKQAKIQRKKVLQYEQDSLSFSRDKSKEFDSVHSLLSNYGDHCSENNDDDENNGNNNRTILTFTKKDVVVLDDDSISLDQCGNYKGQSLIVGQQDQCPTFQNRKNQQNTKQIISFESLRAKRILSKSNSHRGGDSRKSKSRHQTKRLQILTDNYNEHTQKIEKYLDQDKNSCDTKKKFSKSKVKNVKKNSKSEGLHTSMMAEVFQNSFAKKDIQGNASQVKGNVKKR